MNGSAISISPHRPVILVALNWYSPAIHRGIARYASEAGWILDSSMTRHGLVPTDWRGDGIICCLHWGSDLHEMIERTTLPVVNIGGAVLNLPSVMPNDQAIGKLAAGYFKKRGFQNYAFFLKSNALTCRNRCRAFANAARRAGGKCFILDWPKASAMPKQTRYSKHYPAVEHDERRLLDWLAAEIDNLPKPLALFGEFDDPAIDVLYACREQKIMVPEQVAVLGMDNDELRCEFAPVPLSSIDINQELLGYRAASMLHQLLHQEPLPRKIVRIPPAGIVTRQSTDILAIAHPHVASVLRYIWQNYARKINAKTAAATVPISYRWLHNAFLQHVGRTIADEIQHKRLEAAKKLLTESRSKAREIATVAGFPNEDRMGRVFRRVEGMSPMAYRRRFGKLHSLDRPIVPRRK